MTKENSMPMGRPRPLAGQFERVPPRDRVTGCLVGGAIGDAMGAPLEFLTIDQIQRRTGGSVRMPIAGEWTDDTQMTLFTAEACLDEGPEFLALENRLWNNYKMWHITQITSGPPPGIGANPCQLVRVKALYSARAPGTTCMASLARNQRGSLVDAKNDSAGCGGVMRVAPIGLVYPDPRLAYFMAARAAALTHGNPLAWVSAGMFAVMVCVLSRGMDIYGAIATASRIADDEHGSLAAGARRALHKALATDDKGRGYDDEGRGRNQVLNPAQIDATFGDASSQAGGGWTGESALAIAVYAVLAGETPLEALQIAVNHSGDSDSTGAIAGNLLGAMVGEHNLPAPEREMIALRELIRRISFGLYLRAVHFATELEPKLDTPAR